MGDKPVFIKWVLDTRPLWPEAKATRDLATTVSTPDILTFFQKLILIKIPQASRALSLLPLEDRMSVLKYYFLKDAKLALASALLKRHVISSTLRIPFSSSTPTRAPSTKPNFLLPDGSEPLIFNVSHQAGLVAVLAIYHPPPGVAIGIDIVCPSERRTRDHSLIAKDGWGKYVDMHDSVFSIAECTRLKELGMEKDKMLEYFYVLWCLREGYVKMTGEALLAEWLGELEMRFFAPPGERAPEGRELEIWFRGKRVVDVDVRMERYLGEYVICSVVRGDVGVDIGGEFEFLNLDAVLDAAERSDL